MKNVKRLVSILLSCVLSLTLVFPAFAAVDDTGFADVDASDWYADAVVYCRENNLMSGTSDAVFSPHTSMSRAMLVTVLYRLAGSPTVTGTDSFTDTADNQWYSDAVLWAVQNGVINGYGDRTFGTNDPITREQIATILWRYSGSPAAEAGIDFADEEDSAAWADTAVDWARNNGYVNGEANNRFAPGDTATRAQVAAIFMRYDRDNQPAEPDPSPDPVEEEDILVAYFSCTGNTENIANHLQTILNADLYEITPEVPYTDADLNYSDSDSRTSVEMNDPNARPAIAGSVENMDDYEIVFLGYPIWWGSAPRIISTFLESYDFSGKTIIPFCTSGSSGIGSSASDLEALTDNAVWLDGQRFSGNASEATVESWVNGLGLELGAAA